VSLRDEAPAHAPDKATTVEEQTQTPHVSPEPLSQSAFPPPTLSLPFEQRNLRFGEPRVELVETRSVYAGLLYLLPDLNLPLFPPPINLGISWREDVQPYSPPFTPAPRDTTTPRDHI